MKRAFIRGFWGIDNKTDRVLSRRNKVLYDTEFVKLNKYANPFVTYVFGKDNYDILTKKGFNCKLVSDEPVLYHKDKTSELYNGAHYYTHKLHVFREAMKDFDQIVFLDWDCIEIKKTPDDFWDILAKKYPIQAILRSYKHVKCPWRKIDKRLRPCASFVYIADKTIPDKLFELWEERKDLSEEQIIALYTDGLVGGWKGIETYWEKFEPVFFKLQNTYKEKEKNICFLHFNKHNVRGYLSSANKFKTLDEKRNYFTKILDSISVRIK
jgi:hypothetical protein